MAENSVATFGGGCFWCVEAVMQELRGVSSVYSGYAGGASDNPSYREICSGNSGHAEVVQVAFDPGLISYQDLLEIFMTTHDPTTLNRQGADVGTQYRSVIFYHSAEQKSTAQQVITDIQAHFDAPIVTELVPLRKFYPAEEYHQNYYRNNAQQGYCTVVIEPKLRALRMKHADKIKAQ